MGLGLGVGWAGLGTTPSIRSMVVGYRMGGCKDRKVKGWSAEVRAEGLESPRKAPDARCLQTSVWNCLLRCEHSTEVWNCGLVVPRAQRSDLVVNS